MSLTLKAMEAKSLRTNLYLAHREILTIYKEPIVTTTGQLYSVETTRSRLWIFYILQFLMIELVATEMPARPKLHCAAPPRGSSELPGRARHREVQQTLRRNLSHSSC